MAHLADGAAAELDAALLAPPLHEFGLRAALWPVGVVDVQSEGEARAK